MEKEEMKVRKVALWIPYDKKKRILIQDRRGISKVGEEWGWFGGEIEPGEIAEQAVRREIKEELSYNLKKLTYLMSYKYFLDKWNMRIEADVFTSPAPPMKELKQKEGKAMKFFTLNEARKLKLVCKADKKPIDALEDVFKK